MSTASYRILGLCRHGDVGSDLRFIHSVYVGLPKGDATSVGCLSLTPTRAPALCTGLAMMFGAAHCVACKARDTCAGARWSAREASWQREPRGASRGEIMQKGRLARSSWMQSRWQPVCCNAAGKAPILCAAGTRVAVRACVHHHCRAAVGYSTTHAVGLEACLMCYR